MTGGQAGNQDTKIPRYQETNSLLTVYSSPPSLIRHYLPSIQQKWQKNLTNYLFLAYNLDDSWDNIKRMLCAKIKVPGNSSLK